MIIVTKQRLSHVVHGKGNKCLYIYHMHMQKDGSKRRDECPQTRHCMYRQTLDNSNQIASTF